MTNANHTSRPQSSVNRRDVLKGMSAAGAGMVGVTAASDSAEAGALTGGCLAGWPEEKEDRINIAGDNPVEKGSIPAWGDLTIYIHGLFSEDVLDSININGANQATAIDMALAENGVDQPVVAAMYDSTTTWTIAKDRAEEAGRTLADWLESNAWRYSNLTLLAHSLGTRVTLTALNELADSWASVDSVGLFGGAVDPDTICDDWKTGIEESVEGNVYNYHSDDDNIVCDIYAIRELTSGVGCNGADCDSGWWWESGDDLPSNFVDIDMTGDVLGHCNYYKPSTMDFDGTTAISQTAAQQY